ncbi:class II SORL domain-containing protein [bacterium]|nr:class II SORL domain-containing protein [bacterium]
MGRLNEHIQEADWKKEKHAPVIECADTVNSGEIFEVEVGIGREIAHPNTTEHHIRWISLFFHPKGEKFSYQIGHYEFSAHGESGAGANQGPVYSHPVVKAFMKTDKPGTLHALSLCNIHGLWESSKDISIK